MGEITQPVINLLGTQRTEQAAENLSNRALASHALGDTARGCCELVSAWRIAAECNASETLIGKIRGRLLEFSTLIDDSAYVMAMYRDLAAFMLPRNPEMAADAVADLASALSSLDHAESIIAFDDARCLLLAQSRIAELAALEIDAAQVLIEQGNVEKAINCLMLAEKHWTALNNPLGVAEARELRDTIS